MRLLPEDRLLKGQHFWLSNPPMTGLANPSVEPRSNVSLRQCAHCAGPATKLLGGALCLFFLQFIFWFSQKWRV